MRDEDYFDDEAERHEETSPYWTMRHVSSSTGLDLYVRFNVWPPGVREEYEEDLEIGEYDGDVEQLWPVWFPGEKMPAKIASWCPVMGYMDLYEDGTIQFTPDFVPTTSFYVPRDPRCVLQRIKNASRYHDTTWVGVQLDGHPFAFDTHREALAAARAYNANHSDPELLVYVVPLAIAHAREGRSVDGVIGRQKDPEIPGFTRACLLCKHDIVVLPDGTLTRHDTDGLTPVDPESDGPVARVCAGL